MSHKKLQQAPNLRLPYMAGLDPWLHQTVAEVEDLLKVTLLTSQHIVISDNQLLNSAALQGLFRREEAFTFMSEQCPDGIPPFQISLRSGARDFEDVLRNLLLEREMPPIFPWLNTEQQHAVDYSYSRSGRNTIGPFFDIAGKSFQSHIKRMNQFVSAHPESVSHWEVLNQRYPHLVHEAAINLLRGLMTLAGTGSKKKRAELAIQRVLLALETEEVTANRSNLFRLLKQTVTDSALLSLLTLKLLDEPYHINFSSAGGYDMTTGTEYANIPLDEVMQPVAAEAKLLRPEETFDITEFPITIGNIPFRSLARIRGSYAFDNFTRALAEEVDSEKIRILRDLLTYIGAELQKELTPLQKIGRLRLKSFFPPSNIRAHFAAVGLSTADLIALGSKLGGFLSGETIGQMVGVFGIGGILGGGAAVVVERLVDYTTVAPTRRREFSQVVHMLMRPEITPPMANRGGAGSGLDMDSPLGRGSP